MLLGGVLAVLRLELEAILHLAQDGDGFLVRDTGTLALGQTFELLDQSAAGVLVEELQFVRALVQHGLHNELEEVLFNVHQLVEIAERDFRLDHPELGSMRLGIAVFCAEGRSKGVDLGKCHGEGFALKLTGDSKGRGLAEEILRGILGTLVCGQRGHREGVAGAFCIVAGDQRGVHIDIAAVLEIGVDGHGSHGTDAEDRLEQTGPRTQIGDFTEELNRVALGLKRIVLRAVAFERDAGGLHFRRSRILVGGDHFADNRDGGTDMDGADCGKICDRIIIDDLRILEAGSVIKINETNILLLAVAADPSLQTDLCSLQLFKTLFELTGRNDLHGCCLLIIRVILGYIITFAGLVQGKLDGRGRQCYYAADMISGRCRTWQRSI